MTLPTMVKSSSSTVPIEKIDVSHYVIPTDFPESDGTLEWDKTVLVVVEVSAGGKCGLGFTYADTATALLINDALSDVVKGLDAMNVAAAYMAMWRRIRNQGRPG